MFYKMFYKMFYIHDWKTTKKTRYSEFQILNFQAVTKQKSEKRVCWCYLKENPFFGGHNKEVISNFLLFP